MRKGLRSLALCLGLLTAACGARTVQSESLDEADSKTFDAPYARLLNASRQGIWDMNLEIQSESDELSGHVIMFTRRASMMQPGGVGRLVVDKDPPHTVHINYDRRFIGYASGQERWARAIFRKMEAALK